MAERQQQGPNQGSSNRGFASMDDEKQREIARKGGESVPAEERSFSRDRELASEAGRKGGEARSDSSSAEGNESDEQDRSGSQAGGRTFERDPELASEAGRKGGQSSGGEDRGSQNR
jgi:uncharacterized protein